MTEYNLPEAMSENQPSIRQRMAPRFQGSAVVLLLLLVACAAQASERWEPQVAAFAKKIAAVSGPGTATLELRNISSLTAEQVTAIRRPLELQLRTAGVQLRPEHEASVGIRVTLSDNRRGWLWIAEVQQGTETRVTMLEVAEDRAASAAASSLPMTLHSTLLLTTSEVLLDAQPLENPRGVLVALTKHSALLYQQQNGRWQQVRELSLPVKTTQTRDPRGRIVPAADHPFDLYFPGGNCTAAGDRTETIALNCIASDDPWPLGGQGAVYNPARNYFTGLLVPGVGRAMPPFYSAAPLRKPSTPTNGVPWTPPQPKYTLWVFAGVDGHVSSFDGTNERHLGGTAHEWGSDLAALHSGCGAGTQLLATAGGAAEDSDSLQAFEIADREPLAASAPLKFNGSLIALWGAPGAGPATAVVHAGPQTGQGGYDAYSVSLACSQ